MNLIEARCILQCRTTKRPNEVYHKLLECGFELTKNYIYSVLSNLAQKGLMIRKEMNYGRTVISPKVSGRLVYYTATPEAVVKALGCIEYHALRLGSGVVRANQVSLNSFSTP